MTPDPPVYLILLIEFFTIRLDIVIRVITDTLTGSIQFRHMEYGFRINQYTNIHNKRKNIAQ